MASDLAKRIAASLPYLEDLYAYNPEEAEACIDEELADLREVAEQADLVKRNRHKQDAAEVARRIAAKLGDWFDADEVAKDIEREILRGRVS